MPALDGPAAWAFITIMVVTRTGLAGAGHYHLHRKWKQRQSPFTLSFGKALFDINYVGTSLIGSDGHVLLHHPYLGSGADVKKTFFDAMLRLHPILRIPGYTLHKLGICLTGLSFRAREIAKFERPRQTEGGAPRTQDASRDATQNASQDASQDATQDATQDPSRDAGRADFWLIRAWIVLEFALCLATGHILAWLIQFFLTLWFNTFLVVASHDSEESVTEEELALIPEPLRNDWAAQQICLSYDLSVVGNRWIDVFLSAGLSPHRVHHVLPWQGSGFANLASEATVREVCAQVGITWERPRNLIFKTFPGSDQALSSLPGEACSAAAARRSVSSAEHASRPAAATESAPRAAVPAESGPWAAAATEPGPRAAVPAESALRAVWFIRPGQLSELFRYAFDGFRGVGV